MNSNNVLNLMAKPGPGAETPLYRNFKALKTAWSLDAVNNDDEAIYDLTSTVNFARMLGKAGYKYTIAPYTKTQFWVTLQSQLNGGVEGQDRLLDRVYLQCYDGGARNDPESWQQALGTKVVPVLWVTNDSKPSQGRTVTQVRANFTNWQQRNVLGGGGYWNDYDIEKMNLSYTNYGDVLTSIFA
jgi:hypothetical protein